MVSKNGVDTELRGSRRMLLLILAVCLVPVLIAYALNFLKPDWLPSSQTNHGELMKPVQALPTLDLLDTQGAALSNVAFKGHWNLIYLGGDHCDKQCAQRVLEVSNIRSLLRADAERLKVFYIAPDEAALLHTTAALKPARMAQLQLLRIGDKPPNEQAAAVLARQPGSVLLIDPINDWVLSYAPGATPMNMYLDLRHLLRYSHIG